MEIRKITTQVLVWPLMLVCCGFATAQFGMDQYRGGNQDCALSLGRGRSPTAPNPFLHYRDNYDPMQMSMGDCIRYSDVNEALAEAKRKLLYKQPAMRDSHDIEPEDIDVIANVIIETTRILAQRFHLTVQDLEKALPTIDTSKTDIWDICPVMFRPSPCKLTRFRSVDGSCTNMKNSVIGATNTPFGRFVLPMYDDGINAPRMTSVANVELPNVRVVSVSVHKDYTRLSNQQSILLSSWGQFFAHDLTAGAFIRLRNGSRLSCCPERTHRICNPIQIPKNDPFYSRYNETCMDFQRTLAGLRPGCALGPRIGFNLITSRIDGNFIYGSTEKRNREMRSGTKGLLNSWDKFRDLGLKELLPPQTENPEQDCIGRPRKLFCFLSGDDRVNIQAHTVVLHTIFARYHNRLAKELAYFNPHWDDERLFQETRHIIAAVTQHIAYNEFVPLVVGPKFVAMYNLTLQRQGYWNGYDENTPILHALGFQSAAFRFGHSLVHGRMRLFNKHHEFYDSLELHDVVRQPYLIYMPGTVDRIISGLLNAPAENFDRFMSKEVTNRLFQEPTEFFGSDLASLNMMRGRDHGMPGYNDYREMCGMARIQTFQELDYFMGNGSARIYSQLYKHPDDIDLFSAGLSELIIEGGVVGPTFACIIARQFNVLRKGDRFWYENPGFPSSFTPAQLREIRKITQAKVICDNSDNIQTLQTWVMELPHPEQNPRVHCKDLPAINLQYWKEDPVQRKFMYPQ